jgi:hypothetical protein
MALADLSKHSVAIQLAADRLPEVNTLPVGWHVAARHG